ncbi:MAG: ribonuclease III [Pseudomonadota bacterium]
MNKRDVAVSELEARIGHVFKDRDLLERALTHASVGDGATKVRHNERLEFLGDRVLNLLAAEALMALNTETREGEMSRLMAALVNYHACADVARAVGLPDALRLAASATKIGARENDTVLGDACEALMAALYIDGGMDAARTFFQTFWADQFSTLDEPRNKDPKTRLQEWAQAQGLALPAYSLVSRTGPDHAPVFTVQVAIAGYESQAAEGRSKQEAEKAAAQVMLLKHETTQ